MATDVAIAGSSATGRIRNPLGVLGLSLITLGIYGLVWYFKINKELAAIGAAHGSEEAGTSPVKSLLAVTLGLFLIVPVFLSLFGTWKRLAAAERLVGAEKGMDPGLGFLLSVLLSPIGTYIQQANLNKVLQAQAPAAPAA